MQSSLAKEMDDRFFWSRHGGGDANRWSEHGLRQAGWQSGQGEEPLPFVREFNVDRKASSSAEGNRQTVVLS